MWKIPLADVQFGPEETVAVTEVLNSGWLSQGPRVEQFEAAFADYLGVKHAIAVSNGTAALHLACLALNLGPGDEVLCPSLTFVATANAIGYTGARPVFVDIGGPGDLNISPRNAAAKITPRTRAIMLVHYAGYSVDMAAFQALAWRHGLALIEDCAHAPGAFYSSPTGGHKVGSLGTLACFSFFSNKNMTTGEGGLVVTSTDTLAARIRTTRSHGMTTLTWDRHRGHSFSYDVVAPGYNYRLDEIRAALGLMQLSRLEANNDRRRQLTRLYRERLAAIPGLQLPFSDTDLAVSCCHILPMLLPQGADRPAFMAALKDRGIQTSVHYPPIHRFTHYQSLYPPGYDHGLPHTDDAAAREVTLPLYPTLTEQQLGEVAAAIQTVLD
jgi:dTDP-4-amino-4,6-dideoxygalactose transaminase